MKNTRKFAAMAAALTLAACSIAPMTMSASAQDLTITNSETTVAHKYNLYQIFTGTYDAEDGTFTDLKWGSGVSKTGDVVESDITALKEAVNGTDAEKRTAIKTFINGVGLADDPSDTKTGAGNVTFTGLADGYYLVYDVTDLTNPDNSATLDDAHSAIIVQVVGGETATEIAIKKAKPTVDKQIEDKDQSGTSEGFSETADHAIGKEFQFKLTATIPADSDFAAYETYKLVFHDTLSKGITFDRFDSIKINGGADVKDSFTLPTTVTSEQEFTVSIENIIPQLGNAKLGTDAITVEVLYTAHLNDEAIVHSADVTQGAGNATNVNNNWVYLEYSNNPDSLGEGTPGETGKTPKDYVWAFTYGVNNTKIDDEDNALPGATFNIKDANDTALKFSKIASGTNAGKYKLDANGSPDLVSADTTGKFDIVGLDAGTYTIVETNAPDDYVKDSTEHTFVIGAVHDEPQNLDQPTLTLTRTFDSKANTLQALEYVNSKKSSLPETGGIGTTLFYVGGGCMVAFAGIFLITKKRMNKKEN